MKSSPGVALIQALIGALLLGIIAASLSRLVLGRAIFIHRERNAIQGRAVAEAAYLKATECLNTLKWSCSDPVVLPPDCSACGGACSGIFGTFTMPLGGKPHNVSVDVSAVGGSCSVKAVCVSCL